MSTSVEYAWPAPTKRLSSTFFRLLYRWTHSRAFRHNERLWHDVSIGRDARGFLKRMSIANYELRVENSRNLLGIRNGSCHLIGTGPSVTEIDYDALDLAHVMGVNGAIALQDTRRVRFDSYCIVDTGFVRNRPDLVVRVIQQKLTLFTTPIILWYIAQYFPLSQMRCRVFLIEDIQYPAGKRALRGDELLDAHPASELVVFDPLHSLGFSLNIRRGTVDGRTVAYTGLQVLASLGFDTIYLHGLDFANASGKPRFYETAENMQPSALEANFAAFIEPSFRHAAALLKKNGIRVVNLSPHSALGADIFEKADWRSLVRDAAEPEGGDGDTSPDARSAAAA
jgi:hypothetical protein